VITATKVAQSQAIQAPKLATLGEMATSVAHEINQPLSVIRLAAENIKRKLEKDADLDFSTIQAKAERIIQQTERAASIVDHMRMFGRKSGTSNELISPQAVLYSTMDLIGEQPKLAQVEVHFNCTAPNTFFSADVIMKEQVLLNLHRSSRDELVKRDTEKHIWLSSYEGGKIIFLSVEDNTGGVPENIMGSIFEAFFTTKAMGKGAGLGLSISHGIVEDLGGELSIKNTDKGVCFTVALPLAHVNE
jgi:C4-dicarboxylate-specific signal transduction histidine kinase